MDKRYCYSDRRSPEYQEFVENFIKYAFENAVKNNVSYVYCPCKKCQNTRIYEDSDSLRDDLFIHGFEPSYTTWFWHGEGDDDHEGNRKVEEEKDDRLDDMVEELMNNFEGNPGKASSVRKHNETPLYPDCPEGVTILKATLQLMNAKVKYSISDVGFSDLLKIVKSMLPVGNKLPDRVYEANKVLCPMGLEYEKIHACPNDCILYRKNYANKKRCPKCKASRYKGMEVDDAVVDVDDDDDDDEGECTKGVPAKVVWYLPIIPRLERLFANKQDAKNLTWHADRVAEEDDMIRHPADGDQWKKIDIKFPEFGNDARNLRLGICTDGMNPHGNMSSNHSSWPVMVIIYNLPPWLCMKRKYVMLSLLISGPKQPGNDIDVFLAPLVDDLKLLWKGVPMKDVYNVEFTLKAMVFCTVNDFPAYGNFSGYSVKGHNACPICMEKTDYCQLKHGKKTVYLGHRRWLKANHRWRNMKKPFNGKVERRPPPEIVSGHTILESLAGFKNDFGKRKKMPKIDGSWKKKSIFFNLPYWSTLDVRHCLDVMHIEKNVCDSLIGTILNIPGKTKDGVKARRDLAEMGTRPSLVPEERGEKTFLPAACYSLSKEEKVELCSCLEGIRVPTGYSSKVSNLVTKKELRLGSMKSHDCHCMIQEFLPVAIRSVLPNHARNCIIRLCRFFKAICCKAISRRMLDKLQEEIVKVVCEMEMYFPPSFFDIMVHLLVHVVREIKICGPVYLRWMYPFERYMKIFKGYVKNRYRPDASILQRYITEEAIEYCMDFLSSEDSVGLPISRHADRVDGKGLRKGTSVVLSADDLLKAHLCVLHNTDVVQPFVERHMKLIKEDHPGWSDPQVVNEHNRKFVDWFRDNVGEDESETLHWLSFMPSLGVLSYSGYDMNGYSYSTISRDEKTTTQNSGVCVMGGALRDGSSGNDSFYGVIEEILELDYTTFKVPVFKCKWVANNGVSVDELGFTVVDFRRTGFKSDPFIVASQANQVFYVGDPRDNGKSIVIQGKKQFTEEAEVVQSSISEIDAVVFNSTGDVVKKEADWVNMIVRTDKDAGLWIEKKRSEKKRNDKKRKR